MNNPIFSRKITRTIQIGSVKIGGLNPITIQSMTNTKTADVQKTVSQIHQLEKAGCEIVRLAVPDESSAKAISQIKQNINIPLIADIHFDYKLALAALDAGTDGLRLNPGNIGSRQKVKKIVDAAREKKIPIRIGVNSGSLPKHIIRKFGLTSEGIVEAALEHIKILEEENYGELKISVKTSSVPLTIDSYRLLSKNVDYPLHLGVTEAGLEFAGTIKSATGIGTLLAEGIGDTIRVSLTSDPLREIEVAKQILISLGLKKGLQIIACPTCGRTEINLQKLAEDTEKKLSDLNHLNLKIAVMGCVVNGPGEAADADFGIAGGRKEGLLFKKGKIIKKVPENLLLSELETLIRNEIK